jgi:uncharacterized protein (TIGR02680 family)
MLSEPESVLVEPHSARELPPLPVPTRARFQPLRMGLVELFHYDVEEFWFRDGHLLLRGNNGTGKSKVLSLTLPFLLDASLSSTRVEPDGDRSKRMEWNLLMGRHERRVGYTWIEFGRLGDDQTPEYVTLGCGLRAVAGRPRVESWNFMTEQRIGEDLSLVTPERTTLSRERLGEALRGRGQIFETAREYRRAIDERLFRLGERYDALIDTLIQLRQPQLSKKPDEQSLSDALSNAMPELPRAVLEDVAEAMNQLDEYRDELAHLDRVRDAVSQFGKRYRVYAQIQSRRQARGLRKAQTEFDKQSQLLGDARAALRAAEEAARGHQARLDELEAQVRAERARLDELRADPTMSDARRLSDLETAVRRAADECSKARERLARASELLAHEEAERQRRAEELESLTKRVATAKETCRREATSAGVASEHEEHTGALLESASEPSVFASLERELLALAERRRAQVKQLRHRLSVCEQEERERQRAFARSELHRELSEKAEREARRAQKELDAACSALLGAWRRYAQELMVLGLRDVEGGLSELEGWLESVAFEQPMRARLEAAQRESEAELASATSTLARERTELEAAQAELGRELEALHAGQQLAPEGLPTRDTASREGRAGAPFWRLFEFAEHVPDAARVGLEAAAEGAGLLDAWVTPDGDLLDPDTQDAWLVPGRTLSASLSGWLVPAAGPVAKERLEALLASIACGDDDEGQAHTFLSPLGRFRVGTLRGAYHKPAVQYLGHAAREAERERRIALLTTRRELVTQALTDVAARFADLEARRRTMQAELASAPKDDPVHRAHARHAAQMAQHREALEVLAAVEAELQEVERRLRAARDELARDARDMRLPESSNELAIVEAALAAYVSEARALRHVLEAALRGSAELSRQAERERTAGERAAECAAEADARAIELADVDARHRLLLETAGAAVAELTRKVTESSTAVKRGEQELENERSLRAQAGEAVARGEQRVSDGQAVLDERGAQRRHAVEQLAGFAATGLLALALPAVQLPAGEVWTIDPALTLARQVEQSLATVAADDADWTRVQNDVSRDYTALGQALSALGQKAQMEQSDFGLLVRIVHQNRAERPDVLETVLAAEVAERRAVLSEREREVLENHLQADVATGLQHLLREAEVQVERINVELRRRPTSTGVYFRLDWEPLPEASEDSPAGLNAARTLLVRRLSDAWSSDDRRVVGAFLSARIAAERARDDSGPLVEHLARALDYRSWHRFRVKRWHDGAFRSLSGPASSGERALGLTVPLFAAASSHYASGGSAHAPRLVLLDEAFAGIDDEARAHCMALIREFDLDFVMTSEREWGCYATLPGVSICHIVRREGVDAAFVSRWTWDGLARRAEPDPSRRFNDGEHG